MFCWNLMFPFGLAVPFTFHTTSENKKFRTFHGKLFVIDIIDFTLIW